MDFNLDISRDFTPQFQAHFQMRADEIHPSLGNGIMKYCHFPGGLEFYAFHPWQIYHAYKLTSQNPINQGWYAVHINLGTNTQQKWVGDQRISFNRSAGVLLYCPGLEISTNFQANESFELASFRFHRSFLKHYFSEDIIPADKYIMFEDLNVSIEQKIRMAIGGLDQKMKCHSLLLDALQELLAKFQSHGKFKSETRLHSEDIKNLLETSERLRDPIDQKIPNITELAGLAKMSLTKFKMAFKELFGCAPLQYHRKIKMEYAREVLRSGKMNPQELSFVLGYSHPSNFTTAYKNFFNKLPSEEMMV